MFGPSNEEKLAEIRAAYNNAQQVIANDREVKRSDYLDKEKMLERLTDAYTDRKRKDAINFFCEVLETLNNPKYIRLATAIRIIEEVTSFSSDVAGEMYLIQHFDNTNANPSSKTIKTTYREFQEIRNNKHKANARVLKKLTAVYNFVNGDIMDVISQVEKLCKDRNVNIDISKLKKVTEYLDNNELVQEVITSKMPKNLNQLQYK